MTIHSDLEIEGLAQSQNAAGTDLKPVLAGCAQRIHVLFVGMSSTDFRKMRPGGLQIMVVPGQSGPGQPFGLFRAE